MLRAPSAQRTLAARGSLRFVTLVTFIVGIIFAFSSYVQLVVIIASEFAVRVDGCYRSLHERLKLLLGRLLFLKFLILSRRPFLFYEHLFNLIVQVFCLKIVKVRFLLQLLCQFSLFPLFLQLFFAQRPLFFLFAVVVIGQLQVLLSLLRLGCFASLQLLGLLLFPERIRFGVRHVVWKVIQDVDAVSQRIGHRRFHIDQVLEVILLLILEILRDLVLVIVDLDLLLLICEHRLDG